ncbi:MAG: lysophospholipid acyltransferase family protein [Rubripirellula sp.]
MMKRIVPWLVGFAVYGLRLTCRVRVHNDPRGRIRSQTGRTYVFAQLHAHQVAAGMFGDPGTGAMVSRSADAEMIVPTLRLCGKTPVRGSSGKSRKGGATALHCLVRHVESGWPAVIAVDGPRGPRGSVQKGAGFLAQKTRTPVLPVLAIPTRRWILGRTWDRMQIPKPFAIVDVYFGEPIDVAADSDMDAIAETVRRSLHELEHNHDPTERPDTPFSNTEFLLRAA